VQLPHCLEQQIIKILTQLEVTMEPITLGQREEFKAMVDTIYKQPMVLQIKWLLIKDILDLFLSQQFATTQPFINTSNNNNFRRVLLSSPLQAQNRSRRPTCLQVLPQPPTNFLSSGPPNTWVLSVTKFKRRTTRTTSASANCKTWPNKPPLPRLRRRKPTCPCQCVVATCSLGTKLETSIWDVSFSSRPTRMKRSWTNRRTCASWTMSSTMRTR